MSKLTAESKKLWDWHCYHNPSDNNKSNPYGLDIRMQPSTVLQWLREAKPPFETYKSLLVLMLKYRHGIFIASQSSPDVPKLFRWGPGKQDFTTIQGDTP